MKGIGVSSQANALPRLLFLLLVLNITANSQTPAPDAQPGPSPTPTPSLEKQFLRNILSDQVAIWTSPFHMSGGDAKLVVPIGLATAGLIATDRRTANELGENGGSQTRMNISRQVSRLGEFYSTGGIAAAFYLVGVKNHDYRARETGILSAEALIDAGIVSTVIKEITQRPRPQVPDPNDDFFDGGVSFPSGHAITTFALATVIASEYHDHKAIQIAAYGYATAVSISRYTGRNHFLSDVLVGSALGYGIGRYVYKKHHIAETDLNNGQTKHGFMHSKWVPFASPIYSGRDHTYGLALAWGH
jgi:membrane-associated phospholipid phosphatase